MYTDYSGYSANNNSGFIFDFSFIGNWSWIPFEDKTGSIHPIYYNSGTFVEYIGYYDVKFVSVSEIGIRIMNTNLSLYKQEGKDEFLGHNYTAGLLSGSAAVECTVNLCGVGTKGSIFFYEFPVSLTIFDSSLSGTVTLHMFTKGYELYLLPNKKQRVMYGGGAFGLGVEANIGEFIWELITNE